MSGVVIAWSMMGAASFALALIHVGIWLQQRAERAHLYFALFAAAIIGFAVLELQLMRADDVAAYASAQRMLHLPLFLATVGIVGFVQSYLRTGRRALAIAAIAARLLVTLINFLLPQGINYQQIDSLARVPLLGGELVSVAQGMPSPLTHVDELGWLVLFVFVADAVWTKFRRGDRADSVRALWAGGSVLMLIGVGVPLSALIHAGAVQLPYLVMPMFLVVLVTMGYGLTLDVARVARLQRQAAEQRNELAHLSRVGMLGELSGSIAHELNQPLTSILSNAQAAQLLLARGDADATELQSILEDIVDDDKRAGEVIRRLRALLRKEVLPLHPLDVNDVVHEVMRIMQNELVNRGISPRMVLAPALPSVDGDRVQLQQVLMNMLINGCEAMHASERDREIVVRTTVEAGGDVCVEVSDRGTGISEDQLERIFDAFVTTKREGTGLGLALCRTIIESHGGRVWARNNADGGATVGFSLPPGGSAT